MHSDIVESLRGSDPETQREGAFQAAEARMESAVPLLVSLLQSPNMGVQEAAEYALRKIGGRKAVEGLLPLLRSDHPPIRNLGMDLLRALGGEHLELLLPLLKDDDADIRIFMADILGSASDVLAVRPLCDALLHDPEVNVRYQAAVSLGDLARPEAVRSLNQALGDDEWVQFAVIEALMKIRDESSINAFVRALDKSSELVASMIIDALGELGNIKAVPMLMKRLDNSPAALRNKILRAIVRIMGSRSLALLSPDERKRIGFYLLVALDDEDPEIQDAAMAGLGCVGDSQAAGRIMNLASLFDPDRDLERTTLAVNALASLGINAALREAMNGDDEGRILVAIMALEQIGTPEAVALLIQAFEGKPRDVQRTLSSTIARVGGREARDFFLDILSRPGDGTVLKQALLFLGVKLHCLECADSVLGHLLHPYDDVKEAALEAAIAIGSDEVEARFVAMARDAAVVQRLMGVYGLGRLDPARHREILLWSLSDESPDVRKVGLEALAARIHDPGVFKALMRMAHDEVSEVRLALVEVLGASCVDSAGPFLIEALGDEDDWVRIRAVDALANCRDTSHVASIVPLLEDANKLVVVKAISALGRLGGQAAFRALLNVLNTDDHEIQMAAEEALERIQAEHAEDLS